jgi:hypothetical protein
MGSRLPYGAGGFRIELKKSTDLSTRLRAHINERIRPMEAIDLFNLAMVCGIVVMMLAIRELGKSNRKLHARNQREREREKRRYPELYTCDDV